MANIFFPRGEIFPPEQVLDPILAVNLGCSVLELAALYKTRNSFIGDNLSMNIEQESRNVTKLADELNHIYLDQSSLALVNYCKDALRTRLPHKLKFDIDVDFYIGTVANGRWHIDTSRDVRAVVNLSKTPAGLQVATKWNPRDYAEAISKFDNFAFGSTAKPSEPHSSIKVLYGPGEAIVVNNLAREDRQVPHKALASPGRVVMRLFAILAQ